MNRRGVLGQGGCPLRPGRVGSRGARLAAMCVSSIFRNRVDLLPLGTANAGRSSPRHLRLRCGEGGGRNRGEGGSAAPTSSLARSRLAAPPAGPRERKSFHPRQKCCSISYPLPRRATGPLRAPATGPQTLFPPLRTFGWGLLSVVVSEEGTLCIAALQRATQSPWSRRLSGPGAGD